MLAQICGHSQKQGATSRHQHAFAGNWKSRLHHRLQTAGSHNVGQSPAWKRQKHFAGARRDNQFPIAQIQRTVLRFREQTSRLCLMVIDLRATKYLRSGALETPYPRGCCGRGLRQIRPARFVHRERDCRQRCLLSHRTQQRKPRRQAPQDRRQSPARRTGLPLLLA